MTIPIFAPLLKELTLHYGSPDAASEAYREARKDLPKGKRLWVDSDGEIVTVDLKTLLDIDRYRLLP